MGDIPSVYPPAEVARQLGMSASGLRRLARIYEEMFGPLPRDDSGSRLWPEDAVHRLSAARMTVEAGRAKSVAEALASPELTLEGPLEATEQPDQGAITLAVLEELRALRSEVARLSEQLEQKQLEPVKEQPASAAMRGGEVPAIRSEQREGMWARWRRRLRRFLDD